MSNNEDTLKQFCDVTGADETRSRFFLESSNWQLEVALSSFYEHGGNIEEAPVANTATPASLPTLVDSDMESPPGSPERPHKKDKKKSSSKFATLDSLQQESSSDEEEECSIANRLREIEENFHRQVSSRKVFTANQCVNNLKELDDTTGVYLGSTRELGHLDRDVHDMVEERNKLIENIEALTKENDELKKEIARLKSERTLRIDDNNADQGQAFYAGGSERSGQQIIGPGKARKDIVTEMFKSVRERGAVVFEDEPTSTSRGRGELFSGVGYRLGQTADDHEPVTPANAAQDQPTSRSVRLRLYREGFTVDDGPLRLYTDPDNSEFLFCIRRGEIPAELARGAGGGSVRVSLEDRRLEPSPRAAARAAFSGAGHMLGSPTPATVGATAPVAAAASDRSANQRAAQDAVRLDDNAPQTTIQFRLADGSRLTGRFNHTHTVADLRQYVATAEPSYQLQNFSLLTSFPSAELTDGNQTLKQANLLNSTLLQRLK